MKGFLHKVFTGHSRLIFRCVCFVFVMLFPGKKYLQSQNINFGIPEIYGFDRHKYNGGTQTWDIISGKNNRILAANNEGLLQFDGHKWEKYYLPDKTILRSVAYDSVLQKIYVGGQDELGFFQPDKNGVLKYFDIKNTIPTAFNQLEDVWNLKYVEGTLYFRSLNRIYAYNGSQWKVFGTKGSTHLSQIGKTIVYNDLEKGLFRIDDGNATFLEGSELLKNKPITNIISLQNVWYVLTEKDGLIKLESGKWQIPDNEVSRFLKQNRVHSACKINDSLLAVGTYLKGIVFIDHQDKIHLSFTKETGLQNNTIASLHFSPNHQLWVGTYNGINKIDIGSSLTNIYPDGALQGAVYATVIYDGKLYCGTENGLYYKSLETKSSEHSYFGFQKVEDSDGQVWGLDIVFGDLIMSHNDGAFVIRDRKAMKISNNNGSWKFLEFGDQNYCLGGFYSGLYVFRKTGSAWLEVGKISGFDESCRIMVKDDEYLWVSHPYRGLFRLKINGEKLTADIENFGQKNGLPGHLRNNVFNIENEIIVSAEKGFYKFDKKRDTFISIKLPGLPENTSLYYKALAQNNDILWLATDKNVGFIRYDNKLFSSKTYEYKYLEIKNGLVPGFEKIYPLQNGNALFLTTKGLKYFSNESVTTKNMYVYISRLFDVNKQLVVTEGYDSFDQEDNKGLAFDYTSNAFLFDFASSACSENIKYRYYLSPSQKDWSTWDSKSSKEINNLAPGKYQLMLEAMDSYGNVSQPYTFSFEILPPWYRSKYAFLMYFLTIILIIWYSRQRLVNKYEQITTDLEEQKNESEARVFQLQNEKLEAEILYKNKELGLSTMHLVQKNEAIHMLKTELNKIVKKITDPEVKREVKNMISILSNDERLDDDWESFAQNFDAVHNNFLSRLKTMFPHLSPRDLKLCAYLKLNLTTKDIAPLLNISVRGVEISRYRLRKKLDLPNDANLNDYMMNI